MAGRIWIPPYKPLGVSTQAVPGGGYLDIDASAGRFEPSPLLQVGLQAAEGTVGIAGAVAAQLANDNEAVVKAADVRLGEAEQALLFDPQTGYLNTQGQAALMKAPEMLDAYREALDRELAETADDDQRDMLRGLNEGRLADFTTQVERHSEVERQRWYDEAGDRRIAQMRAEAGLHWSDDALLRRALGTTRFEVRDKAERKGWDAALTEAALRQHTSRTLVAAIEGAVERDPDRAQALRTRYDQNIEASDRLTLDALLAEAQSRRRADAASTEILNATPPDGERPTPQWRLRQAEAIAEPAVRAAAIRRVLSADAETQARARALAEQVLARVLKDSLTDPSQIPIREWVTLDAEHRQAIETRLDHNAAGTEPIQNLALVDELATEMTRAPHEFARRDLILAVAHLPLPQWQRFRDWQAGIRRNDPATEDQLDAIKRGLQLAIKMLPADMAEGEATTVRARLVEDIAIRRRITGKSADDTDIADMFARHAPAKPGGMHTLEWDPHTTAAITPLRFALLPPRPGDPAGIHRVQGTNTPKDSPGGSGPDDLTPEEKRFWIDILIELLMGSNLSTPGPGPQRGQTPIPQKPIPPPIPRRLPSKPEPPPTSKPPSASGSPPTKPIPTPTTKPTSGRGHHYVPKAVYKRLDLPEPARGVFERATTGRLTGGVHQYDEPHRRYSDVVAKVIDKWVKRKGVDPKKMTEAEARQLLEHVKCHRHPAIGGYLRMIDDSHSEYCLQRRLEGRRLRRGLDPQ